MLVRSRYIEKFRPFVGLDVVKVITGIRRSGKSVLLQQIQDEIAERIDPNGVFVRINLEEEENARFLSKGVVHAHVIKILKKSKGRKVYVFLDEVHDMEDWEITVNSLRAKKNVDVYITGFQASWRPALPVATLTFRCRLSRSPNSAMHTALAD